MPLAEVISCIKLGTGIVRIILQYTQTERDKDELISEALKEIAEVFWTSAHQAFTAADNLRNNRERQQTEIQVGIGHLRDAFNAYERSLSKKPKMRLIERLRWENWFDGSDWSSDEKDIILSRITELAALISVAYQSIGDDRDQKYWSQVALDRFKDYERFYPQWAKESSYVQVDSPPPQSAYEAWASGGPIRKFEYSQDKFDRYMDLLDEKRRDLKALLAAKSVSL